MRIQKVRITNFRTIRDAEISFNDVTTIIGPNGAGKSTLLYALDWFFTSGVVFSSIDDATYGNENEQTEVRVTFSDLTQKDRDSLGKYAPEKTETFTAWKIHYPSGEELLSANVKGNKLFAPIRAETKAKAKREQYHELIEKHQELKLPKSISSASDVDNALTTWEEDHPDELEDIEETQHTSFDGFNGQSKMKERFNFALVKADWRASEEAADNRSTLIGSIIERAIDRKLSDERISELFEGIAQSEEDIYRDAFGAELTKLSDRLNSVIQTYSGARTVSILPKIKEMVPPKTNFFIKVQDGDNETTVAKQGHGFQRTLLISALQLLSESDVQTNDGVLCLAIEEPELFQYPMQARAFCRVLRSLAADSNKNIQVVFVTHSPYFIEPDHYDDVRLFRRNETCAVPQLTISHANRQQVEKETHKFMKYQSLTNA